MDIEIKVWLFDILNAITIKEHVIAGQSVKKSKIHEHQKKTIKMGVLQHYCTTARLHPNRSYRDQSLKPKNLLNNFLLRE